MPEREAYAATQLWVEALITRQLDFFKITANLFGRRAVVFLLAWLSFGCLLGQFYALWTMHWFGCWVLLPAAALLAVAAYLHRGRPVGLDNPRTWIVQGAVGGVLAAVAYDLYRLPFVLSGTPLFNVFRQFGELLLGGTEPRWLVQAVGWLYHFSNGAAVGIMFLAMASWFRRPRLLWGAVAWALFIEAILLVTPYALFFGLKLDARFLFLTASAHLVFGIALGEYCSHKLRPANPGRTRTPESFTTRLPFGRRR